MSTPRTIPGLPEITTSEVQCYGSSWTRGHEIQGLSVATWVHEEGHRTVTARLDPSTYGGEVQARFHPSEVVESFVSVNVTTRDGDEVTGVKVFLDLDQARRLRDHLTVALAEGSCDHDGALRDELAAAVDQAAVSGLPYDRIAAIYDAARYRYIEGEL